jgi:alkylation response protein AidB-like acyl-CoA dehydrogenase
VTVARLGSPSYALPQELIDLRDNIARIARERIAPRAPEIDRTAEYPQDVRELLAEHDILALPFDTEYGGTGTGPLMVAIAIEQIAAACAASSLILTLQDLATLPIRLFGSQEMKQRVLPKTASGEWLPAIALSEPDAGSDPGGMRTRAVRDGSEWVIDGAKNWISNSGVADFYVVFAVTDPDAGHSRGISAFVVEADRPGFSIGKLEHKMGIRGSPTGSPVFEGCRIPAENPIGGANEGFKVAMAMLDRSRLGVASQALGIARGRPTTRRRTPRSASSSGSRSPRSRGSSSSSPTWRRGRRPLGSSSTGRRRRSRPATPTWASTRRWRSSSPPTPRCG